MDHLCYLCIVFLMLSRLLNAVLWLPVGKRAVLLALVCGVKLCGCYFPIWYPGSGVILDCIDS